MKLKAFIHAQYKDWDKENPFSYHVYDCNMGEYGYTLFEEREIDVEEPSFADLSAKTIKTLQDKQSKIIAQAHKESVAVQRVIDTLLCIEHKE